MRRLLHIVTDSENELGHEIISSQRNLPDAEVVMFVLRASEPDYELLVDEIFRADSIEVW